MTIFQNCAFVFLLINIFLTQQVLASPVLLWSNVKFPSSSPVSFAEISPSTLIYDYVCQLPAKRINLRIFPVDNLRIEDFQRGPQNDHPLLSNVKDDSGHFLYYPVVADNMYEALASISCSKIQFDVQFNSVSTFKQALNQMQQNINNIGTSEAPVVISAIVQGPASEQSISRKKRQVEVSTDSVLISTNGTCMFYADELNWECVNDTRAIFRNYTLNVNASSCLLNTNIVANDSSVVLTLVWNNVNKSSENVTLRITTKLGSRFWKLDNVTFNDQEYRYFAYGMYDVMETPPSYSYVCSTAKFVRYSSASTIYGKYNFSDQFSLINLQFQPFEVEELSFGPPNYCTSFFTSGIWMGVTSSLLCLGILLFGIYHLMSVKSNDRFDDPKRKPLVIKAQE